MDFHSTYIFAQHSITMAEVSPMERILNTPGLVHLAENIFGNLDCEGIGFCRDINQSSRQMLDNPFFWLRKFEELSKTLCCNSHYFFKNYYWKKLWHLQTSGRVSLHPHDVICHMRSPFKYSTKNEDFFPSLHFRFFGEMGKNLNFWLNI